jgi:hypothetical protein
VIRTLEAHNGSEASHLAQNLAFRGAYVAIREPSDLKVIAAFSGDVRPALEARKS